MKYLSVCSGIEAATVAWHPLGWEPVAFAEIEGFPSAALKHHYPNIPNYGNIENFREWPDADVDVLVGGTPCQSFSVAGLRGGLADPRGNLALVFLAIADRYRPRWVVWENVPGVLSSSGGRDFGSFLGALAQLGYGFAYRVLDAQYFGVPQRRRRVFVVGYFGDWRRAAAVLFEPESVSGNPPPSREARQAVTPSLTARTRGGGGHGTDFYCGGGLIPEIVRQAMSSKWYKGASGPAGDEHHNLIPVAVRTAQTSANGHGVAVDVSHTIDVAQGQAVAFSVNQRREARLRDVHGALQADRSATQVDGVVQNMVVRRPTPIECARLQGFPDDYLSQVPGVSDTAQYKALGNSMAVPVMRWIGERIAAVEALR